MAGHAIGEFLRGAGDIWRGARLLVGRPALWPWVLIPFLLNVAVFGLILWAGLHFGSGWIEGIFTGGFWWDLLRWVVQVLFWLTLFIIVIFLFVPVGSLVALPFNDLLSEKVEVLLTGTSGAESFSLRSLTRGIKVGVGASIRMALLMGVLLVPVLLLNLLPGIGTLLSGAVAAIITIRYLSLEYTSYSMDRRYWDWARRKAFLRRNRARSLGMGTMAWLLMMIPVVNALFIPVSAVAGTILFCEAEAQAPRSISKQ